MMETMIRRMEGAKAQTRALPEGEPTPAVRRIEGVAVLFDRTTTLYEDSDLRIEESIDPHAFDGLDLAGGETVLDVNHDMDAVPLARTPDTLQLEVREDGLHIIADVDTRQVQASDLVVGMERGTIGEMSFAFTTTEDGRPMTITKDEGGKEVWQFRVTKVAHLLDVSIVTRPAYKGTTAGLRSELPEDVKETVARAKEEAKQKRADELCQAILARLEEVQK